MKTFVLYLAFVVLTVFCQSMCLAQYVAPNCADGQCQQSPQAIAAAKARLQAVAGRVFHPGGSMGGCNFEGCGSGSTPEQALANCCRPASGTVVAESVVRGNGRYFATRLYQSTSSRVVNIRPFRRLFVR